ncbi:M23 family metallopeptidase [Luteithermobacter gelatinilyticus]|uniref:M23 family metallopeptidase n=1 Tax=Luteithermobacter gelatinilyticus TaxID=2582913 RepID=UPI001AEFB37F|nr:peptidoglycan DD-metalloendopeptidase family protein [Luteithermobacter gelatinilyticus]
MLSKESFFRLYHSLPPMLRTGAAAGCLLAAGYWTGSALGGSETSSVSASVSAPAAMTSPMPVSSIEARLPENQSSKENPSSTGEHAAKEKQREKQIGTARDIAEESLVSVPLHPFDPDSAEQDRAPGDYTPGDYIPVDYRRLTLNRGDGLMDVLVRAGANRREAYLAIEELGQYYNLRHLQIGQTVTAGFDDQGSLVRLELEKDFDHLVRVDRRTDGYKGELEKRPSLTITRHAQGMIEDSLFMAGQKQGLPTAVIVELIRIFSFDVDFQREIRRGDSFEILYERKLSEDGRRVQEGDILYARLTLSGKPITLYRYQAPGEKTADYYHETGQSARKALMKTPIEGARLTSRYGKRKHPVLGYTRMHKGLDFGAPTGTPIMAAGDGVIEKSRRYGSYGNYVRIRHLNGYKTAYAHLSRYGKGIKEGRRVKQGQIIGYVGATGRVTGPHLHYEVLKDGRQVNPLALKIPTGKKLKGQDLQAFQTAMADINQELLFQKTHILLARAETMPPKQTAETARHQATE